MHVLELELKLELELELEGKEMFLHELLACSHVFGSF